MINSWERKEEREAQGSEICIFKAEGESAPPPPPPPLKKDKEREGK
jgi:hypothetical protein